MSPTTTPSDGEVGVPVATALPMWVRAIAMIGIPGAIAIFLVWVGARDLPHMSAQIDEIQRTVIETHAAIEASRAQDLATYRMLQRICANTSKTAQDMQRCFD